jgi:hypothetical protein
MNDEVAGECSLKSSAAIRAEICFMDQFFGVIGAKIAENRLKTYDYWVKSEQRRYC